MRSLRVLSVLLIVVLAFAPAIGFAASDLSASPAGKHHSGRVHHQPDRGWRTVPSTAAPAATVAAIPPVERLSVVETFTAVPLVVRVPFVPPRG